MTLLNVIQINKQLTNLPGWALENNSIVKEWVFKDFTAALQFINLIGEIAEKHNHHPELFNVYSKVKLCFNTHDEGGITQKDIDIALEINSL